MFRGTYWFINRDHLQYEFILCFSTVYRTYLEAASRWHWFTISKIVTKRRTWPEFSSHYRKRASFSLELHQTVSLTKPPRIQILWSAIWTAECRCSRATKRQSKSALTPRNLTEMNWSLKRTFSVRAMSSTNSIIQLRMWFLWKSSAISKSLGKLSIHAYLFHFLINILIIFHLKVFD